ncbi:unnamed protein product [Amaranthus hypochondriacus]
MEDEDEFGDLYTDVLSTFPSSSSSSVLVSVASASASNLASPQASCRPIDLNLQSKDMDDDILNSNFTTTMKFDADVDVNLVEKPSEKVEDAHNKVINNSRVLQSADSNSLQQREQHPEKQLDDFRYEFDDKQQNANSEDDFGMEPLIPGLSTTVVAPTPAPAPTPAGEEWNSDSDSEDDLQIVLNETDHNHGLMGMGMGMDANGMMIGSDDDDGESLVILDDPDAAATTGGLQSVEEQVWGDEAGQSAEGNEAADASKVNNAGLPNAPKIGYSNFGYHSFHSQFKYVRPGAPPLPGGPPAGSGAAPGQVRPPVNVSTMAGRGRGEWRSPGMKGPPMQKGFHPGFWGSNVPGRGLEFTLPSHKTIFDVDIDSFEEKPWKYAGVDESDFFNFGLNEESWKEHCKQLELLRLESTMQSKIRVYESGRAEQEYDPDMPPELAAAAGIHASTAEYVETAKPDVEIGNLDKGSARVLPPLPTGRAIQVETGCGERLPSVDTRPPRIRDSDTVIEIVLQDLFDDGNDTKEHQGNDSTKEDDRVDVVDEDDPQCGNEYIDVFRRTSSVVSCADMDEKEDRSAPERAPSDHYPGSNSHASENIASPKEERWMKEKAHQSSPQMSSGDSALDKRSLDFQREDSIGSMEAEHSPELSFATSMEDTREGSLEGKSVVAEDVPGNVESDKSIDDINMAVPGNTSKHKLSDYSPKQQKLSSQAEPPETIDVEERGEFKASRNSDNSKTTGNGRKYQKWHEVIEEEIAQNGRSTYQGDVKRNHGEAGHDLRRKDRDRRIEIERNYMLAKRKEDYFSRRDWDPHSANLFHAKSESSDRRKEREFSEVSWQRRDGDPHGRRIWAENSWKERADETVSRRRVNVSELDRSDKDEYLHLRNVLDNGIWGGYPDKDAGLRYREKDDASKSQHEILDDRHGKRRKDDENIRKNLFEKDDTFIFHRDGSSNRRKCERDVLCSQHKREDQSRIREKLDDHQSGRFKDEIWMQRERGEQKRDRDEWYRAKQSYEEILPRREREDGRPPIRSSRNVEEKTRASHSHSRGGEDFKGHDKDTGRHVEQIKRRDRVEELDVQHRGEDVYVRGNQLVNEGKNSRQERSSSLNNCVADAPGSLRLHEKKHKENLKKPRDSESQRLHEEVSFGKSKKHQGHKNTTNELADVKGKSEQEHDIPLQNLAREGREDVSSDDEQQNSKRGRSKLERWTSHKERDYNSYSKSSSLKNKEIRKDKHTGFGSSSGAHDEAVKKVKAGDSNQPFAGGKEDGVLEGMGGDQRPMDCHHLDTVEKLKRRSERFKLPLASEKDPPAIKMDSESLPTSQKDMPTSVEVKQERPPRKRRWISS